MKISIQQYLTAFFEVAEEKKQLDQAIEELKNLYGNPLALRNLLENPQKTLREKKRFLEKENISPLVSNFLFILTKQKDLSKLGNIISGLQQLKNEKTQMVEVKAQTAQPLEQEYRINLQQSLEKKLQRKVMLKTEVMPQLLGGIILRIGDKLIDGSLRNRLNMMRQEMMR